MGVYAGLGAPKSGEVFAVGAPLIAYHTFASDGADNPFGDDYQTDVEERYRVVGGPTWSTIATGGSQDYIVYPALTAANYERQVRVRNSATNTWSAWSESGYFTVATPPPTPTISSPAADATVSTSTPGVTWTGAVGQTTYQLSVTTSNASATSNVEWGSGFVTSTISNGVATLLNGDNVLRYLWVRYRQSNGLWSAWSASRRITSSWQVPQTPVVSNVAPSDPNGIGMNHVLSGSIYNPPASGRPTVARLDVFVRRVGDPSAGTLLVAPMLTVSGSTSSGGIAAVSWHGAVSGVTYQIRAAAVAADGRTAYSTWVTATGPIQIKGVLLLDPIDPVGTRRAYRYNDEEAVDDWTIDAALQEYAGRTFPSVEFGDAESRVLTVPVLHSRGTVAGDAAALVALLRRKAIVLYRDRRGRKMYALLEVDSVTDTAYGHKTGLKLTAVNYPADPEVL